MGLIVNDNVVIDENQSLSIQNSYINIHTVIITKNELIDLCYKYQIFFNQEARVNNKQPIKSVLINKTLLEIPTNIYGYIYDDLKIVYNGFTDA
jgi:hypothetical protein